MISRYAMAFICLIVVVKTTFAQDLPSLKKQFEDHYSAEEFGKAAEVGANILLNPKLRPEGEEKYRMLYKTLHSQRASYNDSATVRMLRALDKQPGTAKFKYYLRVYKSIFYLVENKYTQAETELKGILKENNVQYLNDSLKAKVYHNLSLACSLQGRYEERLTYLTKSFNLEKKLLLNNKNYLNYNLSVEMYCKTIMFRYEQNEKAYRIFKEALNHSFNKTVTGDNADLYMNYVDLLLTMGLEHEAQVYIDKLEEFYQSSSEYYAKSHMDFLKFLTYHFWLDKKYTIAIYYGTQSINIRNKYMNLLHDCTPAWLDVGRAYLELGQYDKAIYNFINNLNHKKVYKAKPAILIEAYAFTSRALVLMGRTNDAIAYADTARHIYYTKLKPLTDPISDNLIGVAYYHIGMYSEAIKHFERRKRTLQSTDIYDPIIAIDNDYELSRCHDQLGNYSVAYKLLKQAKEKIITTYPQLLDSRLNIESSHPAQLHRYINIAIANSLNNLYLQNGNVELLIKALSYIEEANRNVDILRGGQKYDRDRLVSGEQYFSLTEQSAKTTMALYEATGEDEYFHKAFYYIQKGKSYALLQGVNDKKYKLNSGVPKETINELNKLKKQYVSSEQRYNNNYLFKENADSLLVNQLNHSMRLLMGKIDSINKMIETKYPKYLQQKQLTSYLTIAEVQERLGTNQVVVDYFLTDERIFRYTIGKTNVQCHVTAIDSTFYSNLEFAIEELNTTFYGQGNTNRIQKYAMASYQLYEKLIGDISHVIRGKELIVIPHSRLSYLPFETLLTKEYASPKPRFKDFPWFIKEQVISYSYNASLLNNTQQKPIAFNKVLAFAPKYTGAYQFDSLYVSRAAYHDTLLMPLKGAQKEIEAIAQSFNTDIYKGKAANKQNFIESLQNNDVLHLAMHSINDIHEPFNSQLVFASSDSINGSFKANELYGYNIQSPLAVLSACSTGSGKKYKGEGVLSMARAFTYAGVESQVMTLWPVDDQSGADITKHFYERLKEGDSKNTALQKSKLEYLASADAIKSHPYYWANYVLSGNTTSIKQKSTKYLILSVLAFALSAVASLIVYRKRKKIND